MIGKTMLLQGRFVYETTCQKRHVTDTSEVAEEAEDSETGQSQNPYVFVPQTTVTNVTNDGKKAAALSVILPANTGCLECIRQCRLRPQGSSNLGLK
jgi:hypothetical protein